MTELAFMLLLSGGLILLGLLLWLNQKQPLNPQHSHRLQTQELAVADDAELSVMVATPYGQLTYVSQQVKDWMNVRDISPNLDFVLRYAQPPESLLALFTKEHTIALSFANRWVESRSYRVWTGNQYNMVVTLQEIQGEQTSHKLDFSAALKIVDEIGNTISPTIGMAQVFQTILTIIQKHYPIDAAELCWYETDQQRLQPLGLIGDIQFTLPRAEPYRTDSGILGWVVKHQQPLLVADVDAPNAHKHTIQTTPHKSTIAIPLLAEGNLIATLALYRLSADAFGYDDLAFCQLIMNPIANAIHNTRLYNDQVIRFNEMVHLQQVMQESDMSENVNQVYERIVERVAHLIGVEICGILLYDDQRGILVGQAPFYGVPDQIVRAYQFPFKTYPRVQKLRQHDEYWLVNDIELDESYKEFGLEAIIPATGMTNFVFFNLQVGRERVGVLHLAKKRDGSGFSAKDLQDIRILAIQTGVVVENLRLFESEQRHDTELMGLKEITYAIGAIEIAEEADLYFDISRRIANLMKIAICGVLLNLKGDNQDVAQLPFYGITDTRLQDYTLDMSSKAIFGKIFSFENFWYTNSIGQDKVVYEADLQETFSHLGFHKTLIVTLTAGGRRLGLLQAANKLSGQDFDDNDARLMQIFATQAAAIIENARLLREIKHTAQQADQLREIATQLGEFVTLNETFAPILSQVATLFDSPLVFLNLIRNGQFITPPRMVYGVELENALGTPIDSVGFERTAFSTQTLLVANHIPQDIMGISAYESLVEHLAIHAMIVMPLLIADNTVGELVVANRRHGLPYIRQDQEMIRTVAAQFASTLERINLYEATETDLTRRVEELNAIARVSNELTLTLDLNPVLLAILKEAIQTTNATDGSIVILNMTLPNLVEYRLGTTLLGSELVAVETLALENDSQLVRNYATAPLAPAPAEAKSALVVCFSYADAVVGLIHVYSTTPHHFDERDSVFLNTMAAKASLAYGNSIRYREQLDRTQRLSQRVEQLNQIFELGHLLQSEADSTTMLEAISFSIVQSVGFDVVLVLMLNEEQGVFERVSQVGLPLKEFKKTQQYTIPQDKIKQVLLPDAKRGESYFYTAEMIHARHLPYVSALSANYRGNRTLSEMDGNSWQDGDMLLLPIYGTHGEIFGLFSLDRPHSNKRPDASMVYILEIFAHQAGATIEYNRLYSASKRNAEMEARFNTLLEAVATTLSVDEIIESVAKNALTLTPFHRLHVVQQQTSGQYTSIFASLVNDQPRFQRQTFTDIEGTLIQAVLDTRHSSLLTMEDATTPYTDVNHWREQGERVSFALPLQAGQEIFGVLYFGCDVDLNNNLTEHTRTLERVNRLISVALQNARLFDQAINLQTFNDSVIESIQQGIVTLDRQGTVMSINQFMLTHYGWTHDVVRKSLFEVSPELVEVLQVALDEVFATGQPSQVAGFGFAESTVRNFYLYPLRYQSDIQGVVLLIEDVTDRTRLEQTVQARSNQLAALTQASTRITGSLQRGEVVRIAIDLMRDILPYDLMAIWEVWEGNQLRLLGSNLLDRVAIRQTEPLDWDAHPTLSRVIQSANAVIVNRIEDLPVYVAMSTPESQSWLGVPIVNQGEVVGMITLTKQDPHFYNLQAGQAASAFANQISVALHNADLFADVNARSQRLGLLNRVSMQLAQSLDSENILEYALSEIASALGAQFSQAVLFDGTLQYGRVIVDHPRGEFPPNRMIPLASDPLYHDLLLDNPPNPIIYSTNPKFMLPPSPQGVNQHAEENQLKDFVWLPMLATGKLVGAFEFMSHDKHMLLGADIVEIALNVANQTGTAIQNANQFEETSNRTRELEMLLQAAQSTASLDLQEVFNSVVELMLTSLDMDDCAIMIWDDTRDVLTVRIDVNRNGDPDRVSPSGSEIPVRLYPVRQRCLKRREVIVITADDPNPDPAEYEELQRQGDYARMFVPLVVRDYAIGLIQVERDTVRQITQRETRLAMALGSQVAVAIDNARLSSTKASLMNESFLLNELSEFISTTLDMSLILQLIGEKIPQFVINIEQFYIALYDPDTGMITFPISRKNGEPYEILPRPLGRDEVSHVIQTRHPLNLSGAYSELIRRNSKIENGHGEIISYLGLPLVAGDEVFGVLALLDTQQEHTFGMDTQRSLRMIASQLGSTIQTERLIKRIQTLAQNLEVQVEERTSELEQERDRLDNLYRITSELASTLNIEKVLNSALKMIVEVLRAEVGVILTYDLSEERLVNGASYPLTPQEDVDKQLENAAKEVAIWLIYHDDLKHTRIDELQETEFWNRPDRPTVADQWHSVLAVQLESNEDIQGVLVMFHTQPYAFTDPDMSLMIASANQLAAAINNSEFYLLVREQSQRLGELLRAEQQQLQRNRAILQGIADGVLLTDEHNHIRLFNPIAEQMLGLKSSDVIDKSLEEVVEVYRDTSAWVTAILNASADEQPRHISTNRITVSELVLNMTIAPVYHEGFYLGSVTVFHDVTRDVEVDQMKNQFILNVSHELRTPLTSIKGYADLLLMRRSMENNSEMADRLLNTIKQNVDRLSTLVDDILSIAELDSGKTHIKYEALDLGNLVTIQLTNVRNNYYSKNIETSLVIQPKLPLAWLDRTKTSQIIANVMDNAFSYNRKDGRVDVNVEINPDNPSELLVAISDTGVGIPDEFKHRVWDRFARFDEHALELDIPGTGLGLSIVRELVQLQGGRIWFHSVLGSGTSFYIAFPMQPYHP
ncbi:MAG: GAF domain-containing protein [Phototrophicaceae bacterium]